MVYAFSGENPKQYADAIYQKFSELVQKRPPSTVNKRLYDINFHLEKIIAIMFANHFNSFALFAVVAYCCIHVILIFASIETKFNLFFICTDLPSEHSHFRPRNISSFLWRRSQTSADENCWLHHGRTDDFPRRFASDARRRANAK